MTLDRLAKKKAALQRRNTVLQASTEVDGLVALAKLQAKGEDRLHPDRVEMDRILQLAFVDMMTEEEADEFSRGILLASAYERGGTLFREQASGVAAYLTEDGGFFPIGVGWGKTGIALMIAERAWKKGIEKSILHIEPNTLSQLLKTDIGYWRRMTNLSVPITVLGGRTRKDRALLVNSGRKGLYILPYSLLSVKDTMDMLETIDPDLVIADECHNLKDRKTARTKRWMAMMNYRDRELVAMSGTITSKSIEDYRHLMNLALKDFSPLPLTAGMAHGWSQVIDSGSAITDQTQAGPLEPLVAWANERRIEQRRAEPDPKKRDAIKHLRLTVSDIRDAYTQRFHGAPGVVASSDSEIKASISIEGKNEHGDAWSDDGAFWEGHDGWDELAEHMDRVKTQWQTPNGDEIEHAMHTFKWQVELGTGFYNELVWPTEDWVEANRPSIVNPESAIFSAQVAHGLHQDYSKAARAYFAYSPAGLDTPLMLALAIVQRPAALPADLVAAYVAWKDAEADAIVEHGILIERLSNAVRVCDFKIDRSARWADWAMGKFGSGIIWVANIEIGRWMMDELKAADIPAIACPAGANEQVTDLFNPDTGTNDAIAVTSIRSHGTGKNLQKAGAQLFLQWPRDAKQAEQTLGRVHRNRVEEFRDHVTVTTMHLLPYDHMLYAACLIDAVYQHQTGSRRKMVYATYDPMPRIFSPEFLKASGAKTETLNARQRDMLTDTFGQDWEDQI